MSKYLIVVSLEIEQFAAKTAGKNMRLKQTKVKFLKLFLFRIIMLFDPTRARKSWFSFKVV